MKFVNLLESSLLLFDFYGAPFLFYITERSYKNNTKLGGMYSFLLIIGVISFGSFRISSWLNFGIPPIIV
jgi:hypothetical protein